MNSRSLLILCLLICGAFTDSCNDPQIIFHQKGKSYFTGVNDIQQAVTTLFSASFDEIKFSSGIYPLKSEFILRSITPIVVYQNQGQTETVGSNTITRSGGKLEISVNFEYQFADRTSAGLPRAGLGKGIGQYSEEFPVEMVKTAEFQNDQLKWSAKLTQIELPNMVFLKESGSDLNTQELNTFTQMLNEGLGSNYVPVQTQLKNRLSGLQDFVANFNDEMVQQIFPQNYQYSFAGKQATYDYSLKGYSLSETGETIQTTGDLENFDNVCYPISIFPTDTSYVGLSKSVVENSYKYLASKEYLMSNLNLDNWKIDNFYFTIRDMSWIIPEVSNNYQYTDKVEGRCAYESGDAPAFDKASQLFGVQAKYTCNLNAVKDSGPIMAFQVDTDIKLKLSFDEIKSIVFKVDSATFSGSGFTSQYKIEKANLASFYISDAAKQLVGTAVFGTGLITLEDFADPQWKLGDDGNTFFFYDNVAAKIIKFLN